MPEQEPIIVLRISIFKLQVCAEEYVLEDSDSFVRAVNRLSLCGTERGWMLDDDPAVAPVTCEDNPIRKHIMFNC